jgi:hypothetical protein
VVVEKHASKLASKFSVLVFVGGFIGLAVVMGFLYLPIGRKIPVTKSPHSFKDASTLRENTQDFSYSGVTDPG